MSMANSAPLCPDKRGGHRCLCHGTVISMKQGFGWIRPVEEIDHPSAAWNRGDIYLSEKDIFPGVTLDEGDAVVFYLYVDGKGLGAESVVQVWHEQAQAMKKVPTAQDISMASALLAVSTLLQATTPPMQTTVGYAPISNAIDFSAFYDDNESDEESDGDETERVKPMQISLADMLDKCEPKEILSVGSALHASGNCKMCSFFPKGTCTNGSACEFCHEEHEKQPRQKNKGKRVRERQKAHLARAAVEKAATPLAITSREEPMKCEVSPFLLTMAKKDIGARQRSPSTGDSTDEGSAGETSDSSTWGSPGSVERLPMCSPPPGLAPPPPSFAPPPMPKYLSAASQ